MSNTTSLDDEFRWPQSAATAGNQTVNGKPTPAKPPRSIRCKLQTPTDVARELAKLYREARGGSLDTSEASKLANILTCLSRVIEGGLAAELERRVEQLEERG